MPEQILLQRRKHTKFLLKKKGLNTHQTDKFDKILYDLEK